MVLSAGKGTRLEPLTVNIPKVMLPLKGKPLLELHINWLKKHGIQNFFFNVHHLANAITDYFQDGEKFGVNISYNYEEELLGTSGSLNGFRNELNETFLLHYGDVYSELDVTKMLNFHKKHQASATLVVHPSTHPHDSDIVEMDGPIIKKLHHKPGTDKYGNLGNAACYILEPTVFNYVKEGKSDFIKDVFPRMLEAGEKLVGYNTDDFLKDMGTFDRYKELKKMLE